MTFRGFIFLYDVWSLICCCLLKGIQAQTVANFYLAFEAQLAIIPVINKVLSDLPTGSCLYKER